MLMGVEPDTPYAGVTLPLQPGDVVVLVTDGLVEAQSLAGQRYTLGRLMEFLAGQRPPASVGDLAEAVLQEVSAFSRGKPSEDDRTLLAFQVR